MNKLERVVVVDCEAGPAPIPPHTMREFGAVHVSSGATFHGAEEDLRRDPLKVMRAFSLWLETTVKGAPVFVSDNPAYDWQWINSYFWQHLGFNPFGHSARRIGDYYAGLVGDWTASSHWKRLRVTKHDHHPVHDAQGNAEALLRMFKGERA